MQCREVSRKKDRPCGPRRIISHHASSGKLRDLVKAAEARWLGLIHRVGEGIQGCGEWKARGSEHGP